MEDTCSVAVCALCAAAVSLAFAAASEPAAAVALDAAAVSDAFAALAEEAAPSALAFAAVASPDADSADCAAVDADWVAESALALAAVALWLASVTACSRSPWRSITPCGRYWSGRRPVVSSTKGTMPRYLPVEMSAMCYSSVSRLMYTPVLSL